MKIIFISLLSLLLASSQTWLTDFDKAKLEAAEKHRPILLNFSGSDWCVPCIHLKKTVFEKETFRSFADSALVLLNADFPRSNKLSKQQQLHNEALAEKYNPGGKFPFTLLLDAEGKVIKQWDGLLDISATELVSQIKTITHAGK